MTDDPTDRLAPLAHAVDATGGLIMAMRDDQWSAATPCADWDVVALVEHLVAGHDLFADALGAPASAARGEHLAARYADSGARLLTAFGAPGALTRTVTVPFGTVPATVALHLRVIEALVHGWDLVQATGLPLQVDDAVAEEELRFTMGALAGAPPDRLRARFDPPQPVSDDAPPLERLAAALGRDVTARR
jgi:uncharacterized protein (TIGR03086 family)